VSSAADLTAPPITQALIPCGGRGTRMLAITGGAPKELVNVAGVAAVERVARECAASGVDALVLVIAPGKEAVARHLEPLLGGPGMPSTMRVLVQPTPRGLADAIRLARGLAADGPVAVALPDNLFDGDAPGLAQVLATYAAHGASTVAMAEISAADAARRGATAPYPGRLDGDVYHIERVPPKAAHDGAFDTGGRASAFTAVGRYAFTGELWEAIERADRSRGDAAELDDVPVLRDLLGRGRLLGRRIRGRFLDVGIPDGWREADTLLRGAGA
jgi:UTP--glucose-1-phosphate uridylyltransferase